MLPTLSEQERAAVASYDKEIADGTLEEYPVWVDERTCSVFAGYDFSSSPEIIEVGCCSGRMISIVEELGFTRYFGVDPSERAIEYCRQKYPQYQFAIDEIRTVGDNYPGRFDAFVVTSVLMHVPQSDLRKCMESLRRSFKVGARGFITTPYTNEKTSQHQTRFGFEITVYNPREFSLLEECGFKINIAQLDCGMLFLSMEAV